MKILYLLLFLSLIHYLVHGQNVLQTVNQECWHNELRSIRYLPDGEDFVITNGNRRFNRAIYGTNSGYRIEAGDLPEFAQYLPYMGGNLKFGFISEDTSKWIIHADEIIARYRPGSMLYEIRDSLLGKGVMNLTVLALDSIEGFIVKIHFDNLTSNVKLFWALGGISATRFNRSGDIGADPESSFFLKPEYCSYNLYEINNNSFTVYYIPRKQQTDENKKKWVDLPRNDKREMMSSCIGFFPPECEVKMSDAKIQTSPMHFFQSEENGSPAITGIINIEKEKDYWLSIFLPGKMTISSYDQLPQKFSKAEKARKKIAEKVKVSTPDPYINTFGGALSIAADAIWENPSYLHGAVAWRTRINGWRGAYCADVLGWHDRARTHFISYAQSQVTTPEAGPVVPDTARHFARQKEGMGTSMFSSGYICRDPGGQFRPHHYDMNLVYIDQLLTHFLYTGDTGFMKEIWPVLTRHLAWEKRNFDGDGDGLYDAYCCIWASDALQYNGGGVTHSSAYNYRANKMAAYIAEIIHEDPVPYHKEADKILHAINTELWIPDIGRYAEYKDYFGLQKVHPHPGLWTVYHAIDSDVPDVFQAYQLLRYVDTEIPHIPIIAEGIYNTYYTLSTTNWMPYTWSLNNVALAELLHTSLAYWQTGRPDEAFRLWKSSIMESMYLGASPGNFQQLSFYDAMRGELYRDFADPIGMAARTLVEGLFGIMPNALSDTLTIRPGFPVEWNSASLDIPDISFSYRKEGSKQTYIITPRYHNSMKLKLCVKACGSKIKKIEMNGVTIPWKNLQNAIGYPEIEICCKEAPHYKIEIEWAGKEPEKAPEIRKSIKNNPFLFETSSAEILNVYDPQNILSDSNVKKNTLTALTRNVTGYHALFVKMHEGDLTWWQPLHIHVLEPVTIHTPMNQEKNIIQFTLENNTPLKVSGKVIVNPGNNAFEKELEIAQLSSGKTLKIPLKHVKPGSNLIVFHGDGYQIKGSVINWNIEKTNGMDYKTIDLTTFFNDKVIQIFKNRYVSPRSIFPTLQIPWQGIGNWCYPWVEANIDDTGLRKLAGAHNRIQLPQGIPLATPGDTAKNNVLFVSQWDNYPDEITIPLTGKASHAYFMMAGSTNPMQSRFINGEVIVTYSDRTKATLSLTNPETWWPIEQDYFIDEYAFSIDYQKPLRVHLKTGIITQDFHDYASIKGFTKYAIDGGAAMILDLPLDSSKTLQSITIRALANEVVLGLMSLTLVNEK